MRVGVPKEIRLRRQHARQRAAHIELRAEQCHLALRAGAGRWRACSHTRQSRAARRPLHASRATDQQPVAEALGLVFTAPEEMAEVKLRLPQIAELIYRLKHEDGVNFDEIPLTVGEARREILRTMRDCHA